MGNRYGTQPRQDEDEDSEEETTGSDSQQQSITGGGATRVEDRFQFGDIVHDRDDSDPENFVVVNIPDAIASEWDLSDSDETLAERDSHYPPSDDVIIVVERDVLDCYIPGWPDRDEQIPISQLEDDGIEYTAHPSERLKVVQKQ